MNFLKSSLEVLHENQKILLEQIRQNIKSFLKNMDINTSEFNTIPLNVETLDIWIKFLFGLLQAGDKNNVMRTISIFANDITPYMDIEEEEEVKVEEMNIPPEVVSSNWFSIPHTPSDVVEEFNIRLQKMRADKEKEEKKRECKDWTTWGNNEYLKYLSSPPLLINTSLLCIANRFGIDECLQKWTNYGIEMIHRFSWLSNLHSQNETLPCSSVINIVKKNMIPLVFSSVQGTCTVKNNYLQRIFVDNQWNCFCNPSFLHAFVISHWNKQKMYFFTCLSQQKTSIWVGNFSTQTSPKIRLPDQNKHYSLIQPLQYEIIRVPTLKEWKQKRYDAHSKLYALHRWLFPSLYEPNNWMILTQSPDLIMIAYVAQQIDTIPFEDLCRTYGTLPPFWDNPFSQFLVPSLFHNIAQYWRAIENEQGGDMALELVRQTIIYIWKQNQSKQDDREIDILELYGLKMKEFSEYNNVLNKLKWIHSYVFYKLLTRMLQRPSTEFALEIVKQNLSSVANHPFMSAEEKIDPQLNLMSLQVQQFENRLRSNAENDGYIYPPVWMPVDVMDWIFKKTI
jgi:hypothetical protein